MNTCNPPEPSDPGSNPEAKTYHCGTLSYTKKGLFVLIGWLLWGDFCFTLMETVVPSIIPLKLNSLGASSTFIALMMSTLPGIFNTTVCPWVSFKSDRHRGKGGRRRPFIIYSMPFLVLSLLFIGFSEQLGGWLHGMFLSGGMITRSTVVIGLLAVFLAMFDLFNMFVGSLYMCLFNDVVPRQYIGRFLAWFRIVGVLTAAGYQYFIFKYALSHMTEIYTAAGLLYLFGFGVMCYMVKEGEYPPPLDDGEPPSLKKDIKLFAKNCFTIPYYWNIFLHTTFTSIAGSIVVFAVFFQQSLGLDLGMIGKMNGITQIVLASSLVLAGPLVDRFNPVRTEAYLVGFSLCQFLFFSVWIFADAPPPAVYFWTFVSITTIGAVSTGMGQTANVPRLMIMFPPDEFGQFCGAQAMVRSGGVMLGGLLAGVYLDVMKGYFAPGDLNAYRFIYLWIGFFAAVAYIFHYRAYRCWKRLGGEEGTAPTAYFKYSDLPKAKHTGVDKKLLLVPISAFSGWLGASLFFMYYFQFIMPNPHNVVVFGVLTALLICFFFGYLRFVRFMERP
jgi:MFS family permease